MIKPLFNISFFFLLAFNIQISKAEIQVVTSIKPIHSLASLVLDGVAKPQLIVDGNNSPHNFSLKPSHAKMLQKADVIFWVNKDLESFLVKPLKNISKNAKKIELINSNGIKKLKFREKNIFENHHDHGKKKHDHHDHGKKKHDHHDHGKKKHDHHDHAHGEFDPHIWLDPVNAKVIVKEMAKQLILLDKENEKRYRKNLEKAFNRLDELGADIKGTINKEARYVVFHDAYQYFENRFNIKTLGALTVNTEVLPGAEQLKKIRKVIKHQKAKCIFSEPQFNPKIINAIAKDTNIKTGILDPLGANLKDNKDLYFKLMKNLSSSIKGC